MNNKDLIKEIKRYIKNAIDDYYFYEGERCSINDFHNLKIKVEWGRSFNGSQVFNLSIYNDSFSVDECFRCLAQSTPVICDVCEIFYTLFKDMINKGGLRDIKYNLKIDDDSLKETEEETEVGKLYKTKDGKVVMETDHFTSAGWNVPPCRIYVIVKSKVKSDIGKTERDWSLGELVEIDGTIEVIK